MTRPYRGSYIQRLSTDDFKKLQRTPHKAAAVDFMDELESAGIAVHEVVWHDEEGAGTISAGGRMYLSNEVRLFFEVCRTGTNYEFSINGLNTGRLTTSQLVQILNILARG